MTINTFGDSISFGYGASSTSKSYPQLLATSLSTNLVNSAVSGSLVSDQAPFVYANVMGSSDVATLMLGTNDERIYGSNNTLKEFFINGLTALSVFLTTSPVKAIGAGVKVGNWEPTYVYGIGVNSQTAGDTISFTVTGDTGYIGYIRQINNYGQFSVKVDGVDKGTYSCNASGITTPQGVTYGPATVILNDLGEGSHQVEVTVVSTSGRVYIDWWASAVSVNKLIVGNVPYALNYNSGGSDLNVDAYNQEIDTMVSYLKSKSLDVELANVNSVLTPSDMYDNYHPNDAGHQKMFTEFLSKFSEITYTVVDVYLGSDGLFYIGPNKTPLN